MEPKTRSTTIERPANGCEGQAELEYRDSLDALLIAHGNASGELSRLFISAGGNPALLFDSDWRVSAVLQMAILNSTSESMIDLRVPSSMKSVGDIAKKIGREMLAAIILIAQGIDDFDNDKLQDGTRRVKRISGYFEDLGSTFERVCG